MAHESLRDVFVVNNPVLRKTGFTDALAVGQLGIFRYDPRKDSVAIGTPNFATDKEIQFIQGTREVPTNLLGAVANETRKGKPIKGKSILSWTGRAAQKGQNQIVAIGFDGVDTTKTLSAKCEESKTVFLRLWGGPIDQIFHTDGKSHVKMFSLYSGCCDDCGDDCANVSAEAMADDLVRQINEDPIYSLGTRKDNKIIKARKVINEAAPTPDATCTEYLLSLCDNGDSFALGAVQTANGSSQITLLGRDRSNSTYQLIQDATLPAPAAFSNAGISFIADCDDCPAGYTAISNAFVYQISRQDAGDATALQAVATQYGIVAPESITLVNREFGRSKYIVSSATALTGAAAVNEVQSLVATGATAGTFTLTFQGQTTAPIAYNATAATVQAALVALSNVNTGDIVAAGGALPGTAVTLTFGGQYAAQNVPQITAVSTLTGGTAVVTTTTAGSAASTELQLINSSGRTSCVLTTPSTIAWTVGETLNRFAKEYKITIKDDTCGVSRLADLQAAFPSLVISQSAAGECVRTFTTEVLSNCVPDGCPADAPVWVAPDAFEGLSWEEVPAGAGSTAAVGVVIESSFVDRITNEASFDYWNYDADPIFIEISQHDWDYNNKPTICAGEWPVTEIQAAKIASGVGSRVREEEKFFKGYERKYRDPNPIVRELQDSELQADPNQMYDQYTLAFSFSFHQFWFGEKLVDNYRYEFYFPAGQGKEFEAAINAYVASVGIDLPPVIL